MSALVEVDLRVGGRHRIRMQAPTGEVHTASGKYLEIDPPRRLVFTWQWEDGPEFPESVVTIELRERGTATEVVLTHEGLPTDESRAQHEMGWTGCLDKLVALY